MSQLPATATRSECLLVLGLDDSASKAEIQRAYRLLVLKLHPDRGARSRETTERFVRVVEAYRRLKALKVPMERGPIPPQVVRRPSPRRHRLID